MAMDGRRVPRMFGRSFNRSYVSSASLLNSVVDSIFGPKSSAELALEEFHKRQEREMAERLAEAARRYFEEKEREKESLEPKLSSIPDYLQPKHWYGNEGDSIYLPSQNIMTKIYAHNEQGDKHFDLVQWIPKIPQSTLEHFRFDALTGKLKDRRSI